MKKLFSVFAIFALFFSSLLQNFSFAESEQVSTDTEKITVDKQTSMLGIAEESNYQTGEIIVKFKENKINLLDSNGDSKMEAFNLSNDLKTQEVVKDSNIALVQIESGKTVGEQIHELMKNDNVEFAQPNFIYKLDFAQPNDTYFSNVRALQNSGQTINSYSVGIPGVDIKWMQAMDIFTGASSGTGGVVAVIDNGVAYNHPDLSNKMRDGTSCKDYNGNALGGCIHGYDFVDNDKDPNVTVDNSNAVLGPSALAHGTHIAGTIAAQLNNNVGIAGVNPNVKIMALKVGTGSSLSSLAIIKAIYFAKYNGAKVISASFGSNSLSSDTPLASNIDYLMYQAIKSFGESGGIFVSSAGNSSYNHDDGTHFQYPSDFIKDTNIGGTIFTGLDNMITVAATDNEGDLASFSDYGVNSISVGAPGVNIYSTVFYDEKVQKLWNVSRPALPTPFVKDSGSWQTVYDSVIGATYITPDPSNPQQSNADTTITTTSMDLQGFDGAVLKFYVQCDSQLSSGRTDYMDMEYSSGGDFKSAGMFDQDVLGGTSLVSMYAAFPSYEMSSNFKVRFRRVTDSTDNAYNGCRIYSLSFAPYSFSNKGFYDYKDGTSMATPNVAGLVSLAMGYKPNRNYNIIKNAILSGGTSLSALAGKTISGRMINAYNTLTLLNNPIGLENVSPSFVGFTSPLASGSTYDSGNVNFTWNASVDTGVGLSGYQIARRSLIGFTEYSGSYFVGADATGYTVASWENPGIQNYAKIRAQDKAGNYSSYSDEVQFTVNGSILGTVNFASGSYTNSGNTVLNLGASVSCSYNLSGDGVIGDFTGEISGSVSLQIPLSIGDGTKTVNVRFYSGDDSSLYSKSIYLDTSAPYVYYGSSSGGVVTGGTLLVTGVILDKTSLTGISLINKNSLGNVVETLDFGLFAGDLSSSSFIGNGPDYFYSFTGYSNISYPFSYTGVSGYWNGTVNLTGGYNNIYISGSDYLGNAIDQSNYLSVYRAPYISSFYSNIVSYSQANIYYESDMSSYSGVVYYGTSSSNLSYTAYRASGNSLSSTISLTGLQGDTIYYYKIAIGLSDGAYASYSSVRYFKTPKLVNKDELVGNMTFTGSVQLSGVSSTGTTFQSSGIMTITGESSSNSISIPLAGMTLTTTGGNWDGIIYAPYLISSTGDVSLTGYSRLDYLTFRIGNPNTEMIFNGSNVGVNLYVGSTYNGLTLKVFRSSDNGISFSEAASCLVSGGVCSFETDRFSIYSLLSPVSTDPSAFSFVSITNAEVNTTYESNTITIAGLSSTAGISIAGGQYSIDGGTWTSQAGTVILGNVVKVRTTTSPYYNSTSTATLTIGSLSSSFNVTTKATGIGTDSGGGGGGGGGGSLFSSSSSSSSNSGSTASSSTGSKYTNDSLLKKAQDLESSEYSMTIDSNIVKVQIPVFKDSKINDTLKILSKKILEEFKARNMSGEDLNNAVEYYNDFLKSFYVYKTENNTSAKDIAKNYVKQMLAIMQKYPIKTASSDSGTQSQDEFDLALAFMYQKGLTKYSDKKLYEPDSSLTRQQAAKMFSQIAVNVLGKQPDSSKKCDFSDIEQADSSLKDYITKACQLNIMNGSNNKFKPNDTIKKSEVLAIIIRMLFGKMEEGGTIWYQNYYNKAKIMGITNDSINNINTDITRYEVAIIVYRVYKAYFTIKTSSK